MGGLNYPRDRSDIRDIIGTEVVAEPKLEGSTSEVLFILIVLTTDKTKQGIFILKVNRKHTTSR